MPVNSEDRAGKTPPMQGEEITDEPAQKKTDSPAEDESAEERDLNAATQIDEKLAESTTAADQEDAARDEEAVSLEKEEIAEELSEK